MLFWWFSLLFTKTQGKEVQGRVREDAAERKHGKRGKCGKRRHQNSENVAKHRLSKWRLLTVLGDKFCSVWATKDRSGVARRCARVAPTHKRTWSSTLPQGLKHRVITGKRLG